MYTRQDDEIWLKVLWLNDEGLTPREIAANLGITRQRVTKILHQMRDDL